MIKLKKLREQIEAGEHDLDLDLKEATDVIDKTILEEERGGKGDEVSLDWSRFKGEDRGNEDKLS